MIIKEVNASVQPVITKIEVKQKKTIEKSGPSVELIKSVDQPQLDKFQTHLKDSIIKFDYFVSDSKTYHGKISMINEEFTKTFTLDDLRINGYWITKKGKYITIEKENFTIRITL